MAIVSVAVLLHDEDSSIPENHLLEQTILRKKALNTAGFELSLLSDRNASANFWSMNSEGTLALQVYKRNNHFEEETGAYLNVTITESFYEVAREDILSGKYSYNLYAADAAGALSTLIAQGQLHNVKTCGHIDSTDDCFDQNVMEELSIFKGQYLISSSALDARQSATLLAYDRERAGELFQLARAGELTIEELLAYCKANKEEEKPFDIRLSREDIFPLYFGIGGSFALTDDASVNIFPLSKTTELLSAVKTLCDSEFVCEEETTEFIISVQRLKDMPSLREEMGDMGILPLPKADKAEPYESYIDLDSQPLMAIPKGYVDKEKVEYLVGRLAFLSKGYVDSYLEAFAGDNQNDLEMLDIIIENASLDLSVLLGYGDIPELFAEAIEKDFSRFPLEYYNRKTLYEKAISIIEKRLSAK